MNGLDDAAEVVRLDADDQLRLVRRGRPIVAPRARREEDGEGRRREEREDVTGGHVQEPRGCPLSKSRAT